MSLIASQCQCGIEAIDTILSDVYGLDLISKAYPNPLTDDGSTILIGRLTNQLLSRILPYEEPRLARAIAALTRRPLDRMTEFEREAAVIEAERYLPNPTQTARLAAPIFSDFGPRLVQGIRSSAIRTHNLSVGQDLSPADRQLARSITSSQGHYISSRSTLRNDSWVRTARRIISDGSVRGLSRSEIVRSLERSLGIPTLLEHSRNYYRGLSAAYVHRMRTFVHLTAMHDAGVSRYQWVSILDHLTTIYCHFMHGKIFSVQEAIQKYRDVEGAVDPDAVRDIMPWMRTRRDIAGREQLYVRNRSGAETVIATVRRLPDVQRRYRGSYIDATTRMQLEDMGVICPPVHGGFCRSRIIPL